MNEIQQDAKPRKLTRQQKWRSKNPQKYVCHLAVSAALRHGVLVKEPCAHCGATKGEAHHPDYDRPFHVIWLCRACHKVVHNSGVSS